MIIKNKSKAKAMISIIGNIKIDFNNKLRVKGLIACLRSLKFLGDKAQIIINIEHGDPELMQLASDELDKVGADNILCASDIALDHLSYGKIYMRLLQHAKYPFIMNFIEDHFCVLDDAEWLEDMLIDMTEHGIDVCKASFHQIEQTSVLNIWGRDKTHWGQYWTMNEPRYADYCRAYGERYFLGVNFITTKEFALKFWNRDCGKTPHGYELARYDPAWEHTVMVPDREILAAVDDGHGEWGSNLLARQDKKFWEIYNSIEV